MNRRQITDQRLADIDDSLGRIADRAHTLADEFRQLLKDLEHAMRVVDQVRTQTKADR